MCITLKSHTGGEKGVRGNRGMDMAEGEESKGRSKARVPAWLTVDSVGCDFHSLLAVCVEAITSVTGCLINEPLSSVCAV